jgi:hypothetical protein
MIAMRELCLALLGLLLLGTGVVVTLARMLASGR